MRTRPVLVAAVTSAVLGSALPAGAAALAPDPLVVRADALADRGPVDGKALVGTASGPASIAAISDEPCVDGQAGPFPCLNVDLAAFVPLAELGGTNGNDIWGWTDRKTGHEYAIIGTGYGTSFVDVTEPTDPVLVATTPTESAAYIPLWRDIKVFRDHAFIVSEHTGHGLQVLDLTRLRGFSGRPLVLGPDAVYDGFSWAHNIAVNGRTGFAYAVGTDTCEGGLHAVDIRKPTSPRLAGCFSEDGYTHDAQCVVYAGPDGRFRGREVCFASNEDSLTIVDVTRKDRPRVISRTEYPTASYTHQGWLTEDQRFFLFGDELDELDGTTDTTTTYIADVSRLDRVRIRPFAHETSAIDHNLYTHRGLLFEANYSAGLRILDYSARSLRRGQMEEVAYFDVFPAGDPTEFVGAWSSYPYFRSGTVVVSGIESGLFVLRPDLPEPKRRSGKRLPA